MYFKTALFLSSIPSSSFIKTKSFHSHIISQKQKHEILHQQRLNPLITAAATATTQQQLDNNDGKNHRQTDSRGFLIPQVGDIILYEGTWRNQDVPGIVNNITFTPTRSTHTVDITPLKRMSKELFIISKGKKQWMDISNVRILSNIQYIPRQDAYLIHGVRDGYEKLKPLKEEERILAELEYKNLQNGLYRQSLLIIAIGTIVFGGLKGVDGGIVYLIGGTFGLGYLKLLSLAVDDVGGFTSGIVGKIAVFRFVLPVLAFLMVAFWKSGGHLNGVDGILGTLNREDSLLLTLGLLSYKFPFLYRAFNEFIEGQSTDDSTTSTSTNRGMLSTFFSLGVNQLRQRNNVKETMERKKKKGVFIFAGPSGVGKSTLIQQLLQEKTTSSSTNFEYNISHTTRHKRDEEKDSIDYNFVSDEKFNEMIKNNEFIEYAEIHGEKYGTSYESINVVNGNCILDLDVQGIENIRNSNNQDWQIRYIWIAPVSLEALEDRLRKRGSEDEKTVKIRMGTALKEMEYVARNGGIFDLVVVNDDFDVAYNELNAFVQRTLNEWD